MYTTVDFMFKEGSLETYSLSLDNGKLEYIHCIVIERIDFKYPYTPNEIRVKQIHNLEEYYKNPKIYDNFSERILKTSHINIIINK